MTELYKITETIQVFDHKCPGDSQWEVRETVNSYVVYHKNNGTVLLCDYCPFCGYKAGEK